MFTIGGLCYTYYVLTVQSSCTVSGSNRIPCLLKGDVVNPKVLIISIVVLVVALAVPILLNTMRASSPAPAPASSPAPAPVAPLPPPPPPAPAETAETPPPADYPVVYAPPPRTIPQYEQRQSVPSGPALTAETLVGTAWEAASPYGPVVIELGPNGQATATHSMVGTVTGSWHVNGSKVTATVSFMGQTMSMDAEIKGSTLKVNGQSVRRLR